MSEELKELLNGTFVLRQKLSAVLPPDAVDYIAQLVVKDRARMNMEALVQEEVASE